MIYTRTILTMTLLAFVGCQSTPVGGPSTKSQRSDAATAAAHADQAIANAEALAAHARHVGHQADATGHVVTGQPRVAPGDLHWRRALAYRAKAMSYAQLANTEALLAKEVEDPIEREHWLAEARESAAQSKHFHKLHLDHAALARQHQ
ncbi:MAG: hypothetical protein CMJ49_06105 [Planctomycetaceae bacterium]|nr:hypothetical protein [Planctomycetaceae bacterium]